MTGGLASGFMGSVSGSAIANVVTTGTFTIPLLAILFIGLASLSSG